MGTQGEDGLPAEKFRYYCVDVRQLGAISEFGQAILTNDGIKLRMSFFLHVGIFSHG